MASWARSASLAALVLVATVSGCVKAIEEERPEGGAARWGKDPFWRVPPPPTPTAWCSCEPTLPRCPVHEANATFDEPAALSCAGPTPPLFEPFGDRRLRDCLSCTDVDLDVHEGRILVASAEGLDILRPGGVTSIPPPEPLPVLNPWTVRSPTVAVAGVDVWYAAVARSPLGTGSLDVLVVGRWDGASGWTARETLALHGSSEPTLAERVQLVPVGSAVVALAEAGGRAWSVPLQQAPGEPTLFAAPDLLVRPGRPVLDPDGRAVVPYVWQDALDGGAGLAFAILADTVSGWSHHPGPPTPSPPREGTRAALDVTRGGVFSMTWVDAHGALWRASSPDGTEWSDPLRWAPHVPGVVDRSFVEASRDGSDARLTLAWEEGGGAIVLARGAGSPLGHHVLPATETHPPALAMLRDRAVVAWVEPGVGLRVAIEGEGGAAGCDDASHCQPSYVRY